MLDNEVNRYIFMYSTLWIVNRYHDLSIILRSSDTTSAQSCANIVKFFQFFPRDSTGLLLTSSNALPMFPVQRMLYAAPEVRFKNRAIIYVTHSRHSYSLSTT